MWALQDICPWVRIYQCLWLRFILFITLSKMTTIRSPTQWKSLVVLTLSVLFAFWFYHFLFAWTLLLIMCVFGCFYMVLIWYRINKFLIMLNIVLRIFMKVYLFMWFHVIYHGSWCQMVQFGNLLTRTFPIAFILEILSMPWLLLMNLQNVFDACMQDDIYFF